MEMYLLESRSPLPGSQMSCPVRLSSSQSPSSLTPDAFLLAAGSIGVCIHRFFNTKILADAKEWLASTLFHHISGL